MTDAMTYTQVPSREDVRGSRRSPRWGTIETRPLSVQDVMTPQVVAVIETTTFKSIVELLIAHDLDGVPVVGPTGDLVGMVTEADLISHECYGPQQARTRSTVIPPQYQADGEVLMKANAFTARDLMNTQLVTCGAEDDLRLAAQLMLGHKRNQLPVVHGTQVIGMVSRRDLLTVFDRNDDDITEDVNHALRDQSLLPEAARVSAWVGDGVVHVSGVVDQISSSGVVRAVLGSIHGVVDVIGELTAAEATGLDDSRQHVTLNHDPPPRDELGRDAACQELEVAGAQLDVLIAEGVLSPIDDSHPQRFRRAEVVALREAGG